MLQDLYNTMNFLGSSASSTGELVVLWISIQEEGEVGEIKKSMTEISFTKMFLTKMGSAKKIFCKIENFPTHDVVSNLNLSEFGVTVIVGPSLPERTTLQVSFVEILTG